MGQYGGSGCRKHEMDLILIWNTYLEYNLIMDAKVEDEGVKYDSYITDACSWVVPGQRQKTL